MRVDWSAKCVVAEFVCKKRWHDPYPRHETAHVRGALLFVSAFAVSVVAPSSLAGGEFRRFPQTVSPDGSYILGWGARANVRDELASLKDVSADSGKGTR